MIDLSTIPEYYLVFLVTLSLTLILAIWFFGRKQQTALYPGMPYTPFKLIEKVSITHNTRRFKIALQTPSTVLGLPIGKHFNLRFFDEQGDEIIRPYTPVTSDDELGYVELVIKIYPEGRMGQYLDHLNIGDSIDIMGPKGFIHYDMPSHITLTRLRNTRSFDFETINMIAGGTGLTPMYQVIQQIIKDKNDHTEVKMIYGNITESDILCREDLEAMREVSYVDIVFTLDKPSCCWKEEAGYVTPDMIKKYLASPSQQPITVVCGPPPMMKAVISTLKSLDYPKDRILSF
jgi:cytochrome-b5 reductase